MSPQAPESRCPRCHQSVRGRARVCPHCRERIPGSARTMMMVLGGIGVLFLVVLIGLAIFMKPTAEETGEPDQQAQPAAAPAKKPPLD